MSSTGAGTLPFKDWTMVVWLEEMAFEAGTLSFDGRAKPARLKDSKS
jgi:hypothetical protein